MAEEKTYLYGENIEVIGATIYAAGSILTPAQITTNTDDYNPTGFQVSNDIVVSVLRMDSDANRDLTGLVPSSPAKGNIIIITNIGTSDIKLKNNDANSVAANRFLLKGDINIEPNESYALYYDTVSLRWRPQNNI